MKIQNFFSLIFLLFLSFNLCKSEKNFDEIFNILQNNCGINLSEKWMELIKDNHNIRSLLISDSDYLSDIDYSELVSKGINKVLESFAFKGNYSDCLKLNAVDLAESLMDLGEGVDIFLKLAKEEVNSTVKYSLLNGLVARDYGFNEAVIVAKNGCLSKRSSIKESSLDLFKQLLIEKNLELTTEILNIIKLMLNDKNYSVRYRAYYLLVYIVQKGLITIEELGVLDNCLNFKDFDFIYSPQKGNISDIHLAVLPSSLKSLKIPISKKHFALLPPSLKSLNITHNTINVWELLLGLEELITRCPKLEKLKLPNYLDLTDEILITLAKLPNLKSLSLSSRKIKNEHLAIFPSKLKELNFFNSGITDEKLVILLDRCPNLTSLNLTHCDVTHKGITLITEKFPNFKKLNLSSCKKLTDNVIQVLPIFLRKLNLSYCYNITNDAFVRLSKRCPYLTDLKLGNCKITNNGLVKLLDGYSNLRKLDLNNCHDLTGEGLKKLSKKCPYLEYLNLLCCENMKNEILEVLPDSLKRLDLHACYKITNNDIVKLVKNCPNLKWLDLSYTSISDETLSVLKQKFPKLKIEAEGRFSLASCYYINK